MAKPQDPIRVPIAKSFLCRSGQFSLGLERLTSLASYARLSITLARYELAQTTSVVTESGIITPHNAMVVR